jgi:putative membrane protein
MKNYKHGIFTFLKGVGMGAADVVPGVSGGTIAFITGIYERLIGALTKIDGEALKYLLSFRIKKFLEKIDGYFLLVLFAGILLSIFSLAKILQYLLLYHRTLLWAFFFGLVLASIWIVAKKIPRWTIILGLWFIAGTVFAWFIASTDMILTPHTHFFIFLSGMISIMAMILPGISGSYILLILGKYQHIIGSVTEFTDWLRSATRAAFPVEAILTLIAFAIGAIIGLLSFARLLKWLLKHYHDVTISILTGFMLGSLYKIWPWKETITTITDRHGIKRPLLEKNIIPSEFNQEVFLAILLALGGFLLVYFIEMIAEKYTDIEKRI